MASGNKETSKNIPCDVVKRARAEVQDSTPVQNCRVEGLGSFGRVWLICLRFRAQSRSNTGPEGQTKKKKKREWGGA